MKLRMLLVLLVLAGCNAVLAFGMEVRVSGQSRSEIEIVDPSTGEVVQRVEISSTPGTPTLRKAEGRRTAGSRILSAPPRSRATSRSPFGSIVAVGPDRTRLHLISSPLLPATTIRLPHAGRPGIRTPSRVEHLLDLDSPGTVRVQLDNDALGASTETILHDDSLRGLGLDSPQPIVETGACCLGGGGCRNETEFGCSAIGGQYRGPDVECIDLSCAAPTGACCLAEGLCAQRTDDECADQGGSYLGAGVTAAPGQCLEQGNVNAVLDLVEMSVVYEPTSCGGTASGTMRLIAVFRNAAVDATLTDLSFTVASLTNDNTLCNADLPPGTPGSTMTVAPANEYADQLLGPGEEVTVEFRIGLSDPSEFIFLVDAFATAIIDF